jgi:eukaryotic-like serine/threonine-protein kinase
VFSSPTVAGDLLFIGSCSGNFYALDKNTGQARWVYNIRQDGDQTSFHDDPLIAGDSVIIGTDAGSQGHLYAFDRSTGKVRWKYLVRTADAEDYGVVSDSVSDGNSVYAVAKGDDLVCLDLATGQVRWHFASNFDRHDNAWENSPALDGKMIIFAGHDGVVYALEAHSGTLIWKTNLHAPVLTSPVIVGSSIYTGTSGQLYRLRSADGRIQGSYSIPVKPWRNVTLSRSRLFLISSDKFYDGVTSGIVSVDLGSDRIEWRKTFSGKASLGTVWPYVWQGEVLASDSGHLYAYRESDGSLAWSHDFPGHLVRGIGVTNDILYLGTMDGMIYAFTPARTAPER